MTYTDILPYSFILAWILDFLLGDPSCLPHPVVYMGKWISFGEKHFNRGTRRRLKGALFALFSILAVYTLLDGLLGVGTMLATHSAIAFSCTFLFQTILIFFCLAGKTLRDEVRMVFEALEKGLDEGRRQVSRIVGRDTRSLSAQEVRTAALETLAENLSDGVIAPLFWLALLGVPGMVAYKMVNTLDSMIGYHSPRYREFGCVAARIDDVANYIPARITAFLIATVGAVLCRKSLLSCWRFTMKYGPCHASPNSGWPEAALASLLNCRFGGPHEYFGEVFHKPYIGSFDRTLDIRDMRTSIRVCFISEITAILILCLTTFL